MSADEHVASDGDGQASGHFANANGLSIYYEEHGAGQPLREAVELYRHLPNAELAVIPGMEHNILASRAELVSTTILDFVLRQVEPSRATSVLAG